MAELGAWHGDPELKARMVERMRAHRADDALVQGLYQRHDPTAALSYRGCAIGCLLDKQPIEDPAGVYPSRPWNGWHGEVQRQFGIPWDVAALIDDVFEGLQAPLHAAFAVDVIAAVPVGADLRDFTAQFETRTGEAEPVGEQAARLIRELQALAVPEAVTGA